MPRTMRVGLGVTAASLGARGLRLQVPREPQLMNECRRLKLYEFLRRSRLGPGAYSAVVFFV